MNTYIALIRGINVGGRNKLPMKDLRDVLEGLGHQAVRTYLQSGNVVFQSKNGDGRKLARDIGAAIRENHPFAPEVLVLTMDELRDVLAANPFPEARAIRRRYTYPF